MRRPGYHWKTSVSMPELPSGFWGAWIVVLTIVGLSGVTWFALSVYFARPDPDHAGPVWDENLREDTNPAPLWWFWLLFSLLIFSVIYLMLYPGLGPYRGMLQWSAGGRLANSELSYQAEFGDRRRAIADGQLTTLHGDALVMASAKRVYDRNCAVCHGYDAAGQASLFPDLTDDVWEWGGTPEQIETTIRTGRNAAMPSWASVLGEDGVENVANYVLGLGAGAAASQEHAGRPQFEQICAACHGLAGEGNAALGAPSLVDDVWLYGGDLETIKQSITDGRTGVMPAFGERLDDTQVRLLVALLTKSSRPAS